MYMLGKHLRYMMYASLPTLMRAILLLLFCEWFLFLFLFLLSFFSTEFFGGRIEKEEARR